jgi:hypothetical protein
MARTRHIPPPAPAAAPVAMPAPLALLIAAGVRASWLPAGASGPIVEQEGDAFALCVGADGQVLHMPCTRDEGQVRRAWLTLCTGAHRAAAPKPVERPAVEVTLENMHQPFDLEGVPPRDRGQR